MKSQKKEYVLTLNSDHAPLTDAELDILAVFLVAMTPDEDDLPLSLSTVDGFFNALAISPQIVLPQAWLTWILGDVPPFSSEIEAQTIVSLLVRHYHQVQHDMREINPPIFAPLYLYNDQSEEPWVAEWCDGFMSAVHYQEGIWYSAVDHDLDREKLDIIYAMTLLVPPDVENPPDDNEVGEDEIDRTSLMMRRIAYYSLDDYRMQFNPVAAWEDLLEVCVMHLRDHLLHPNKTNLCPCGSNKEFDDCCGSSNRQLH
jgi:uncharacterized protein